MTAEERLIEAEYEDVVIFRNPSYDDALIGVSDDNRAIYDFEKMVEWLYHNEGMELDEAVEFIEFNTLRAIPYTDGAPIIMYSV